MCHLDSIRYFVTDKSITLFWEKPDEVSKDVVYQVILDDKMVGKTKKTHYTVDELNADQAYTMRIEVWAKDSVVQKDCGVIRTSKSKKRKDITLAPYYAAGDGVTLNTAVIQQAIDECGIDDVLYIPAGTYLTGALRLHSDMEVYLEEGAVLQGTDRPEDYLPRIPSRFEGYEMECYSSLINMGHLDKDSGYNCRNVMIHGKGSIVGGGLALATNIVELERVYLQDMLKELGEGIKEYETADTIPGRVRGRLVNMSNCQNIILSGIHFADGPCWNIHMIYSDNIVTHNCTVKSRGVWNGDGWDPDSSTNCTIFGTAFYTGDDAIAIKSGKNPEGNIINRPCEHIRIFDCISKFGHGIAMGSEMSGGIRDVKIWDCDMGNTKYGIEIKGTKKRGSFVKDVQVRDCKVSRILFHSVGYNDDGIGAECPPLFADCSFENLHILGEYLSMEDEVVTCDAFELIGFDEKGYEIQNVVFKDILMQREVNDGVQSLSLQYCKNITLQNVEVREKAKKNEGNRK